MGQAAITKEEREFRINVTARHEAAHGVIAAVQGLRLRSEGMAVDRNGEGLTCYCKQPEGTDASRECIIITTYAGFYAQKRYSEQYGHDVPDEMARDWSPDFREARKVGSGFSDHYRGNRGLGAVDAILQQRAAEMVKQHWHLIEGLAQALLAKDWEPVKALKSNGTWATAAEAKYLVGEEIVSELKRWEISAVCLDEC
jgi:hypothetical protein